MLVIVPGIGDDLQIYQTFRRRWEWLGYDAHVISFGWIETTAMLEKKLPDLLQKLDVFGSRPVYIIGVSAGGTAAILAMDQRPNIQKVITICSPLNTMTNLRNPLLAESIRHMRRVLAAMPAERKANILSVFALYDQVVDTRLSQVPGIAVKQILSVIHAPTVFIALMVYAGLLSKFMKAA